MFAPNPSISANCARYRRLAQRHACAASAPTSRPPPRCFRCRRSRRRVLVVDDEPPILRFLRTSLAAVRHRVVIAEDAAGTLAALAADKPDVVILDLGSPTAAVSNSFRKFAVARRRPALYCRRAATNARASCRSISSAAKSPVPVMR
jgi:CheY-like chemotaxis protein